MPELKSVETSRWHEADIEVRYIILENSVMSIIPYVVGQLFLR